MAEPRKKSDDDDGPDLKQQIIPDPNRKVVPEVETAAEQYVKLRNKRMKATELEVEAAQNLLALMHDHKLRIYSFDGQLVTIAEVEKVKVAKLKDE